jgi:hypothetical protein
LPEDVGGLVEEHQMMKVHEGYPGSLMIMERYDQETLEDVHVSQGPPFMRGSETVGHTHTHGDSRARGSYEATSIWVPGLVDIHVEFDPVVHPGYMMMQEDTGACISIQGHTVMRVSSQGHAEVYSGIQGDALECREETYLVEHGDSSPLQQYMDLGDHLLSSSSYMSDDGGSVIDHEYVELPTIVPDGLRLVTSTSDYSPGMLVDEFLVKPLGLTSAYDTPQSYIQLRGTWRVVRQIPPDIIYNRIGEVRLRQSDEALGMMESILSRGTEYVLEVDIGSESQQDKD